MKIADAVEIGNKADLNELESPECEIEKAKEQAVREFAERLNAEFENFAKMVYYGTTYTLVGKGVVNRVTNEMFPKGSDTE